MIIDTYNKLLDYLTYRAEEPQTLPWFEIISIDHDAGDYADQGGDFIKVLDWMEEHHLKAPIHIHSMNVVGRENMRRIIERNGWKEVF